MSVFIDSICALWLDAKMSNIMKIPANKCWDVKIRIIVNNKSFPMGELFKAFNALGSTIYITNITNANIVNSRFVIILYVHKNLRKNDVFDNNFLKIV